MSHRLSLSKNVVCVLIVITLAILTATPTLAQESELNQIATSLARNINAGNGHTITVADFTDLQGNVTELGRFIAEELSTQLVMQAKSFSVVERVQLAAILKEHQISVSGLVDPVTIRKLGHFAGVDAIVTGTLVPFADSVRLTAKVLDVSTAKVIAVSAADLPRTKAVDDLLSRGISSAASSTGPRQGPASSSSPKPSRRIPVVHQHDFQFAIKDCVRRDEKVLCTGSITNRAEKARAITLVRGGDATTAVDNNGNSYPSERIGLGQPAGPDQLQLVPELLTNFFVTFSASDQSASTVTVVVAYWVEGAFDKAVFRDIPIAQR